VTVTTSRFWATITILALGLAGAAGAEPADMTFFVTSAGSGKGADFGGLAGADRHCQTLAAAAGAGQRTWRAYLSTQAAGGAGPVDARSRSVEDLHGENNLTKQTAITEKGEVVNGRGDQPNRRDILTGSQPDGTAFAAGADRTCSNWSSSGDGHAQLGHHDRMGLRDDAPSRSWNSSHPSRGCSDEALRSTGGAGLLYCFAAN